MHLVIINAGIINIAGKENKAINNDANVYNKIFLTEITEKSMNLYEIRSRIQTKTSVP